MNAHTKYLLFLLFSFVSFVTFAQVETIYIEKDCGFWTQRNLKLSEYTSNVPFKKLPSFNIQKVLLEEDETDKTHQDIFRYGIPFETNYSFQDGTWYNTEQGRLWALTITASESKFLNFLFTDVRLPDGAYIFIFNREKNVMIGNITQQCVNKNGNILTDLLPGSSATIFLYEPEEVRGVSRITIEKAIYGYRDISLGQEKSDVFRSFGDASSCNIDVACKPVYSNESNAVGILLESNGYVRGTGSLLMSTDRSFTPYFLTAFHSIDLDDNNEISLMEKIAISDISIKFNYKKATCEGNTLSTSVTYSGLSYTASWGRDHTDFALLKLNENVKNNPYLYYLGWDRSGSTPTSGACIHHPKGDVMKISIENSSFQSSKWQDNYGYTSQSNDHWKVYFDEGITEGGSSGAPILNQNKRVVGQLHGGIAHDNPCNNTDALFGKFSISWLGGGMTSNQLRYWLDPNNTGATTMDGSYPPGLQAEIVGDPVICNANTYTLTGVPSIYTIQWSLSNTTDFSVTPGADSTCVVSFVGSGETSTVLTARVYFSINDYNLF